MGNIKNRPDHSEKTSWGIVRFSPHQLLLGQSFMDVGHLGRAAGWDWDFRQLDSGNACWTAPGRDQLYTTLKFAVVQRLLTGPHRPLNSSHGV